MLLTLFSLDSVEVSEIAVSRTLLLPLETERSFGKHVQNMKAPVLTSTKNSQLIFLAVMWWLFPLVSLLNQPLGDRGLSCYWSPTQFQLFRE